VNSFKEYSSIVREKTNHAKKHVQKPEDFSELKYHLDHIISIRFGYDHVSISLLDSEGQFAILREADKIQV